MYIHGDSHLRPALHKMKWIIFTWVLVFPGRQVGRMASFLISADLAVSVSLSNLKLVSSKLWNIVPEHNKYNSINQSKYWTTRSHIWSNTFDLKNQRIWVGNHQLGTENMNSWNIKYISYFTHHQQHRHTTPRSGSYVVCLVVPNTLYRNTIV